MVRAVRNSQRQIVSELLKKYKDALHFDGNQSIESAMGAIIAHNPDELVAFQNRQDEFNFVATVSLATGHLFRYEDFEDITEKEYKDLFGACKNALGGDSNDFFSGSAAPTSSKTRSPEKTPLKITPKKPSSGT
jgi:hypothetical protein